MYQFGSRVRYSECDENGIMTPMAIIDYFQDCSSFHSEDLGVGIAYLEKKSLVWVLSAWQIEVEEYPRFGDEIAIGTFPYDFKGFMGSRNFFIQNAVGKKIIYANSIWSLLHVDTMKPSRPTESMLAKYQLEEKLRMEYAPRKIAVPQKCDRQEEIVIKSSQIDSNHHVNNGQYVRIAMEVLPKDFHMHTLRAEYKKQALLNDVIVPFVGRKKEEYVVSLCDTNGEIYAVVALK